MSKNFLTREGYDKLIHELQELKQEKLPAVLERLAEAKSMGDLSENFEYKSAMEDKDFINSRILEITNLIADVEIIEKDITKTEKDDKEDEKLYLKPGPYIGFWSEALLRFQADWKEYRIQIVGTWEVELGDVIKISFEDGGQEGTTRSMEGGPLGRAIRWLKAGDTANFHVNLPVAIMKDGKKTHQIEYAVDVLEVVNWTAESRQHFFARKRADQEKQKKKRGL